jgi:hypothetical protein
MASLDVSDRGASTLGSREVNETVRLIERHNG